MTTRSLILIKPDGVKRGLIGKIVERLERPGLKIIGMKMVWIDEDFSKKHYKEHVEKDFYKNLEKFIVSGPIVAIVVEGVEAVENVRKIVGDTEPYKALPGTIRGDFAHHHVEFTNREKKAVMNLIHASANKKEAEEEINLWFSESELHDYSTVHEDHVF
jgi:nucleoside-diphosphate kinase